MPNPTSGDGSGFQWVSLSWLGFFSVLAGFEWVFCMIPSVDLEDSRHPTYLRFLCITGCLDVSDLIGLLPGI